ncbi:hypothetical protein [Streptomyces sp. NBC_01244]|uniref:hypothetical protein n=1 Tax=Streptomyces sp. NBC_01244 TaxID=2903797 RepID=UPI002E11AF00|nr:hypothetical protein OG247_20865 [Streptomyces sp. NBC_01244]
MSTATKTLKTSADADAERREARNSGRRAKRRAEARQRKARHAAFELCAWGAWSGGRPRATAADVARRANAMYGAYLKGNDITVQEGADALAWAISL